MQKQETRVVRGSTRTLEYELTRKAVKNINMRIKVSGKITVSAPFYAPVKHIDDFVLSQEKAIIKALDQYEKVRENAPKPLEYVSGETVDYLGEKLCLVVCEDKKEGVERKGDRLFLKVKDVTAFPRKERLVKKWLAERTLEVFDEICRETYPLFQPYGVQYPQIKIRTMKSRWGSCQPGKGVITLNAKMIAAPRETIEYVVLHEFAHFIHPNHSRNFYDLVARYMPDWKQRKAMLQDIS